MRRYTEVPQVKVSNLYLQNWIHGIPYKFVLEKRPKTRSFGKVTINFI
jgi:hypothetical protein